MVLVHFAETAAHVPFTFSVNNTIALFPLRSGRPFETDHVL